MIYFHVFIIYLNEKGKERLISASPYYGEKDLKEKFSDPFNEDKPFWIIGKPFHRSKVKEVYIFPSETMLNALNAILPNGKKINDEKNNRYIINSLCRGLVSEMGGNVTDSFIKPINIEKVTSISHSNTIVKSKIFIVHGRDKASAVLLKNYLKDSLHLNAELFDDYRKRSTSSTIIEVLEYVAKNVDYVFVVATPDDLGCLRKTIEECKNDLFGKASLKVSHLRKNILSKLVKRPRLNVAFEHGLFIGVLGRDKVCCLFHKEVKEKYSDFDGILYVPFEESVENTFTEIREKLKEAKIIKE